jgi:alkylmercury lyase
MTFKMTQIDIRRLGHQLVAARPQLDEGHQRIAITLYRLLAEGRPVSRERLAKQSGSTSGQVARFVDGQPGVYLDDHGRVAGFRGMALAGTLHRTTVRGRELRAWCAWDALFLPELLDETVAVTSTCPTTGEQVELVVTPQGVRDVSPAGVVLSFLRHQQPFDADTIKTFCHFVHFFASAEAATQWTAQHPGTFVLSIDEGLRLARHVNRASFGTALRACAQGVA